MIVGSSLPSEAEGTLGPYALMVKPTRALLFGASVAALRSFISLCLSERKNVEQRFSPRGWVLS